MIPLLLLLLLLTKETVISSYKYFALKVVEGGEKSSSLHLETIQLKRITDSAETSIMNYLPQSHSDVHYVKDSNHQLIGAAAMFGPVGISIHDYIYQQQPSKKLMLLLWKEVSFALIQLHIHNILHGDPRMPNLLRVHQTGNYNTRNGGDKSGAVGQLVWIDFRQSSEFSVEHDCRVCIHSFFRHPLHMVNSTIEKLILEYPLCLSESVKPKVASDPSVSVWQDNVWKELNSNL